jgi:hypothetical protein
MRATSPTTAYWRVTPRWVRYSDFYTQPPRIVEVSL